MSNEGSLFVVVIGTIEGMEERNSTGLTVALGGDTPVPIGHLTKYFITSNCATFAEKPKVFIIIDLEVTTNYMDKGVPVSNFSKIVRPFSNQLLAVELLNHEYQN